jgi:hypothetical protein
MEDAVERLIAGAIRQRSNGSPEARARAILESLWEAGYEVTRRPDLIPIQHNPGEAGETDAASIHGRVGAIEP